MKKIIPRLKAYICQACFARFKTKDALEEARCPKCASSNVARKAYNVTR